MAPKINDIVAQTGVSASTVSRILNGEKKYKYAAATVELVKHAAHELGYRPNFFARSLKEGRTNCIGLMNNMGVANFSSPYLTSVMSGVENTMIAEDNRYSLLVFGGTNEQGARETRDLIRKGLVDGLIFTIVSSDLPNFEAELLPLLKENDLPFVVIHSLKDELPYNSIGVDMEQAGYLAARHLLDTGRRISFYDCEPESALIQQVKTGIGRALTEQGLSLIPEDIIMPGTGRKFYTRAFNAFMDIEQFPEAVIMPTDQTCQAFMLAACRRGVRIPDDCDVIRISDAPTIRETLPGIPYIDHPVTEKAGAALHMLMGILDGTLDKNEIHRELMVPELMM